GRLRYGPVDASPLAGQRVLLIGDGASAATVLAQLLDADARIDWVTASDGGPGFASEPDDPLPARRALFLRARAAIDDPRVTHRPRQWVAAYRTEPDALLVTLEGQPAPLSVDAAICCTGFRPDLGLHRELQVHS